MEGWPDAKKRALQEMTSTILGAVIKPLEAENESLRASDSEQRQMLSWAASFLMEHHKDKAERIFAYLNKRAGG